MTPFYIDILGKSIAVYQNKDHGLPLVFIHGNSLSASTFKLQFSDQSLSNYKLITFDLPGHGNSYRSNNPENDYSPVTFIKIIIELCNKLNAANGILVGHSLGGHMALDALEYLPNVRGLVTFGTTPLTVPTMLEKAFLPNPALGLIFKPELTDNEIQQMAGSFVAKDNNIPEEIIQSIKQSDPLVRHYIGKALNSGQTMNEVGIVRNRNIPFAIFQGQEDQLINPEYFNIISKELIWKNKVQIIDKAGHTLQLENPNLFNKLLIDFIEHLA
ncbi:MAG TPA: alpha/beta hydrolase [Bacteroidales bacterium]|nr:alpha/beta hydrolase [Bacteroidales bacterium]